jgi:histidinol-phosphate aminotransferase
MRNIAKKNVLSVKPYLPGKPIEEVKRELGLKEVYKLASNENPYPPTPKVVKAIVKELKELNRYPDGNCFCLRQAIAQQFGVEPEQIVFGNGSDEIIFMATRAFAGEGDEIITAHPTFLIYEIATKVAGATIRMVPLKDFRFDLGAIRKAVTEKTKIIFIANPNNPTGTYITQRDVEHFLKDLPRNIVVFFDEAYYEFVDKKDYPNSLKLLQEYPNVIFTRTFSKAYSLAGLRIGYGIASKEMIDILNRVREPFNVNSLAQAAALAALSDQARYLKMVRALNQEKKKLYKNLYTLKVPFIESEANFVLINLKADSLVATQQLLRKGVIVRDMGFWGLENFIRVSIGTPQENKKFIQALKEIL